MKNIKRVLAVMTAIIMVLSLCSCSKKGMQDEVFAGELVDAQGSRIVVRNVDETILFATSAKTEYELQEDENLCVGDQLEVEYRKDRGVFVADTVRVVEHEEQSLVFGGEVTELEKHYLTVRSESLSAGFDYDEETKIEGNLSEGDAVTITYEGNLSERPKAKSIIVIQEKREENLKSVHGTVSEKTDDSVLVSLDSADAYRFQVTTDTIINGDDTKLKVGDEVSLVYSGELTKSPVARTINIKRVKTVYYVMDGVIDKVSRDELIVKTSKKSYAFQIKGETRIQNKSSLKKNHRVTITYVGKLGEKPVAASIYCSKQVVSKQTEAASRTNDVNTEKEKTKKTESATKKTESKKTETKKTESATKKTETKKATEQPKKTETKKSETKKSETKKTEASEESKATEETKASEEQTEEITEEQTEEQTEEITEEQTEEQTEEVTEEQTEEQTEEVTEEQTEEQTEEATEEEPQEPEEPEMVPINASGTIVSWKNPCTIKIDGNGTVKLDISDASVSGGYVPQSDDEVIFTYDKDSMKLLSIQLSYRPVDEPEDEDE